LALVLFEASLKNIFVYDKNIMFLIYKNGFPTNQEKIFGFYGGKGA
jgi:hypothetical protein